MPLVKTISVDQITVTENGIVLVRTATVICEDGVELSRTYSRDSYQPGESIADAPAQVVAICSAAWTPEVLAAFAAQESAR